MSASVIQEGRGAEEFAKVVDMQKQMAQAALKVVQQALGRHEIEREVAKHIKEQFDRIYYPNWHCIVGKSFTTVVTYESRHYVHFQIAGKSIVLFKFG